MNMKIVEITEKLYKQEIDPNEAERLLLDLFAVSSSLPPTDDEIDAMVEEFVQGLNVDKKVKRNVAFGYQEGLYKMRELWRQ